MPEQPPEQQPDRELTPIERLIADWEETEERRRARSRQLLDQRIVAMEAEIARQEAGG